MTTIYLAQKLMSVNLDRSEFQKVKQLQKSISKDKHTAVESLKILLKEEKDRKDQRCRLCLREGAVKIFSNENKIVKDIKFALEIEVSEGDDKPQHICNGCLAALERAVELKKTAELSQWRLQQEAELMFEAQSEMDDDLPELHKQHGGFFVYKAGWNEMVRQWICRQCRKLFNTHAEFADHENLPNCRLTTASDLNQRFVCEFCGQAFRCSMLLHRHRQSHIGGEASFSCGLCTHRAPSRYAARLHRRAHTGERPHTCKVCNKSFSNPANLWSHKKIHQPPKHHCHLCQKSYTHKMLLNDHIATKHSTETPFNCQTCGKAFATRKRLNKHERGVHNRPVIRKTYDKVQLPNEEQS